MNSVLFIKHVLILYLIVGLPLTIVLLKMALNPLFSLWDRLLEKPFNIIRSHLRVKYDCPDFYYFYNESSWSNTDKDKFGEKLTSKERLEKYPEIEIDWANYQRKERKSNSKFAKTISNISNFLDDLDMHQSDNWTIYCMISWFLALIGVVIFLMFKSDYKSQKAFYCEGRYAAIEMFNNYEQLEGWNKNAKRYITEAESLNKTYFEPNGKIKKHEINYIMPDENGNYPIFDDNGKFTGRYLHPIDTNVMYQSFLEICQNEKEILK